MTDHLEFVRKCDHFHLASNSRSRAKHYHFLSRSNRFLFHYVLEITWRTNGHAGKLHNHVQRLDSGARQQWQGLVENSALGKRNG